MVELLSTLSLSQVLIYGILIALAAKEALVLKDFFKKRTDDKYAEEDEEKKQIEQILSAIQGLERSINSSKEEEKKLHKNIENLYEHWKTQEQEYHKVLQLLIESDKESIKSFIVKEHHHFIDQKWIDDFSLDTIEKRYSHYREEGGDAYIGELIQDLRALPNFPPNLRQQQ